MPRSGDPGITVRATGARGADRRQTRWQIAYWPETSSLAYLCGIGLWVLAALLVAVLLFAALVMVMFRNVIKALRPDEVTIVTLMKDFRDGRARRERVSGLAELQSPFNS